MIPIKCPHHPDCDATYLCRACGLLCNRDIKDENSKCHIVVLLNDSTKCLYEIIYAQQQLHWQSAIIVKLKKSVTTFLNQLENSNSKKVQVIEQMLPKFAKQNLEIDIDILKESIAHSIMVSSKNDQNGIEKGNQNLTEIINNIVNANQLNNLQNTNYKFKKLTDDEWKSKYDIILNKYGSNNSKVQCASIILQNANVKEGTNIISDFCKKCLKNNGAFAIGYVLRKNSTIHEVNLIPDKPNSELYWR